MQPFADPTVGAVAGNVKVATGAACSAGGSTSSTSSASTWTGALYDTWRCMPTIPGALGAFRRAGPADVGGVSDDTIAEDTDLTMAIHRAGWRVVYEETARAYTEAPATLGAAVEAAVPVELRHDAGDVEAPPVAVPTPARPAGSAGAGCVFIALFRSCCRCWRRWWTHR